MEVFVHCSSKQIPSCAIAIYPSDSTITIRHVVQAYFQKYSQDDSDLDNFVYFAYDSVPTITDTANCKQILLSDDVFKVLRKDTDLLIENIETKQPKQAFSYEKLVDLHLEENIYHVSTTNDLYNQVVYLIGSNHIEAAIQLLKSFKEEDKDSRFLSLLFKCGQYLKDYDREAAIIKDHLSKDDDSVGKYYQLAKCSFLQANYQSALHYIRLCLQTATENSKRFLQVIYLQARVYMKLNILSEVPPLINILSNNSFPPEKVIFLKAQFEFNSMNIPRAFSIISELVNISIYEKYLFKFFEMSLTNIEFIDLLTSESNDLQLSDAVKRYFSEKGLYTILNNERSNDYLFTYNSLKFDSLSFPSIQNFKDTLIQYLKSKYKIDGLNDENLLLYMNAKKLFRAEYNPEALNSQADTYLDQLLLYKLFLRAAIDFYLVGDINASKYILYTNMPFHKDFKFFHPLVSKEYEICQALLIALQGAKAITDESGFLYVVGDSQCFMLSNRSVCISGQEFYVLPLYIENFYYQDVRADQYRYQRLLSILLSEETRPSMVIVIPGLNLYKQVYNISKDTDRGIRRRQIILKEFQKLAELSVKLNANRTIPVVLHSTFLHFIHAADVQIGNNMMSEMVNLITKQDPGTSLFCFKYPGWADKNLLREYDTEELSKFLSHLARPPQE